MTTAEIQQWAASAASQRFAGKTVIISDEKGHFLAPNPSGGTQWTDDPAKAKRYDYEREEVAQQLAIAMACSGGRAKWIPVIAPETTPTKAPSRHDAKAYEKARKERNPTIKRLTVQIGHIKTQIPKLNEDDREEIRRHLNAAILLTFEPTE